MAGSRLQHLADQEAEKLALGIGADPDPYALERPLERANRMSRVFERQPSMYNVNAQGMPVAAIGQVDVTDPWGNPLMGMDSPYDASIAYAANPSKLASRQSFYFAPGSGGMGGSAPTTPGFGLNRGLVSPALSGISSISSSGNNAIWSEVSSSSSGQSSQWHTQSQKPLSSEQSQGAPYQQHPSHHANGQNKRRSVSFQGDLAALASGRRSPGATSMYERSSRNESGSGEPSSRMKARSSTHLPSLLGNGRRGSYAESRKSFVAQDLPPIPVDPKLLAKKEKRMSKAAGHASHGAKDRSDAMSVMSGVSGMSGDAAGGKASKRKSWFARSTSSDNVSLSSSTSRQHVPSQPSRPPPVPTLPPQHSGSSSLAPQHSGSSSSALSAGQPRSGPTTPLASPRLATPPAASIYGTPGSGNPSPAVSPLASPSGGGLGPALLRPGSSRQPSRAAMNMPSPVEEHPPSQLQIPATLQEASPTPTARSLSPVPSSAQLSLQPMPSDAAAFASSAPTTPTTSGLLAPAEIIKPSASSPDDLSAVAGGLPISSHTAIEAGRLPVRASSKSASPFGHGSSPSSLPPSLNLQQAQIPKTPSVQSISPDQIPLPDTPQYGGSITSSPVDSPVGTPVTSRPGTASGASRRLSPEQLAAKVLPIAPVAIEALNIPQGVHGRTLQPRASSPNLGRQNAEPVPELPSPISFDRSSPSLELPEPKSSRTNGKADQPAVKKSSKSPFGFFRRGRSKTLGESEAQQEQLSASTNGKKQPASTDSKSSGAPPVPTPQLSFSSSTTSTLTSSEAFYADFSPSARPSFSNSRSNSNSTAITGKRDGGVSPAAPDTRKTGTFSSLFSSRKNRGAISTGPK